MQFLTVLTPKRDRYEARFNTSRRGMYFNDFDFELHDDTAVEGVAAAFGPNLRKWLPHEFWPHVEAGSRLGCEWARGTGFRLCCVQFTLLTAKYHDVDTSLEGVQTRIAGFVAYHLKERLLEPVWPLHADWLTSDVVAVARGIDANGALDGLPALTDALLEAGCDHPLALEHLRTCPDHGTSCWVVEMICAQAAARDAGTSA